LNNELNGNNNASLVGGVRKRKIPSCLDEPDSLRKRKIPQSFSLFAKSSPLL
jgi:hypothetical protein